MKRIERDGQASAQKAALQVAASSSAARVVQGNRILVSSTLTAFTLSHRGSSPSFWTSPQGRDPESIFQWSTWILDRVQDDEQNGI
jgi:hypothetical protein